MSAALSVTDASFDEEVLRGELPVLVDFWAGWCPPCTLIAPLVEELAQELEGRVRVVKVDYDSSPATASRFQVLSIPTLMVFSRGRPLGRLVGYLPRAALRQRLDAILEREA